MASRKRWSDVQSELTLSILTVSHLICLTASSIMAEPMPLRRRLGATIRRAISPVKGSNTQHPAISPLNRADSMTSESAPRLIEAMLFCHDGRNSHIVSSASTIPIPSATISVVPCGCLESLSSLLSALKQSYSAVMSNPLAAVEGYGRPVGSEHFKNVMTDTGFSQSRK